MYLILGFAVITLCFWYFSILQKEKRDKQLEYAQKIKERNKKDFQREMFRPSRKPEHEDDPKDDMLHRRNIVSSLKNIFSLKQFHICQHDS